MADVEFSDLRGKVLSSVSGMYVYSESVVMVTSDGDEYVLSHDQDCCETVHVEDVCGNVEDIIGTPILVAEEVSGSGRGDWDGEVCESYTWTFYKLDTARGSVVLRWLGESNGYYSEAVDLTVEYRQDPRQVMLRALGF